eukprot:scaffold58454_cov31-Tisochrysis_lutea.AAC.5
MSCDLAVAMRELAHPHIWPQTGSDCRTHGARAIHRQRRPPREPKAAGDCGQHLRLHPHIPQVPRWSRLYSQRRLRPRGCSRHRPGANRALLRGEAARTATSSPSIGVLMSKRLDAKRKRYSDTHSASKWRHQRQPTAQPFGPPEIQHLGAGWRAH